MVMQYFACICFKFKKFKSLIFPSFTKKNKYHKSRDFIAICPVSRTVPDAKQALNRAEQMKNNY